MTDKNEKEISKLRKKRGTLRASVTNLLKKIENSVLNDNPDKSELDELLEQIKVKEHELKVVDSSIEDLIDDLSEFEDDFKASQEYIDKISLWKIRAKKKLEAINKATNTVIRTTENETIHNTKFGVKLPKISISKFNGDVSEFQNFWSSFDTAIHSNDSLSKVEKFNYLRSYLTSSAYDAVAGFSLSDENYDAAVDLLKERFGRQDLVINAHMSNLLSMKPIHKSTDVSGLRKLYDFIEIQIRSLKSLGVKTQTFGNLLCPIIMKAIPYNMALDFSRQNSKGDDFNVENLISFLRMELEARERSKQLSSFEFSNSQNLDLHPKKFMDDRSNTDKFNRKYKRFEPNQKFMPGSATTLSTVHNDSCVFCSESDHKSDDCSSKNILEKREILKKGGRCFLCFKKFHLSKFCKSKIECSFCHKRHRKALCEQVYPLENLSEETVVSSVVPTETKVITGTEKIFLQTVRAVASNIKVKANVRCLLDGGSQRSFIREELSRKLKLPVVGEESLNLHTFGKTDVITTNRRRVKLTLSNQKDKSKFIEIELLESPEICSAVLECPNKELILQAKKLKIELSDISRELGKPCSVDILIGSDFYWQIVSGRMKRIDKSVMLLHTIFGWSAQGSLTNGSPDKENSIVEVNTVVFKEKDDDQLASDQLKAFWELDSLGVITEPNNRSISDQDALKLFESRLQFRNGRYEVSLPWKYEDTELPNNYRNAKKRLDSLLRRFQKNENLYEQYQAVISEYLDLGIIEEVKNIEKYPNAKCPIYYLPHHPVVRTDKETTKLRIVFDASSHSPGFPSLNDLLHPGPNLNPDLLNLLLRFRLNPIALIADVEKAFLQISLSKDDRDSTRFLWLNETPKNGRFESNIEPKIYRMTRVLFGVTSSPFLLAAVLKTHIKKHSEKFPKTCEALENSMYVDDFISGATDVREAFKMSREAKEILEDAKMCLRKWQTNSQHLKELWEANNFELAKSKTPLGNKCVPFKVLGLIWDPDEDIFKFDVTNLLEFIMNAGRTKRAIIKASGRIFDPVGFLSPYTVRVKLIFQELWELGIEWDENLPENIEQTWTSWCDELPALNILHVPRYYFSEINFANIQQLQVHCFTDASEKAYGAVAYLRFQVSENVFKTSFISSKNRIAPLKRLSVPRLELMGALIGARLVNHFQEIFGNFPGTVKKYFWTDSKIALSWIRSSPSKWKPFVANRIGEIQSLCDPHGWKYCPGPENPADMLTRGKNAEDLLESSLWWFGPGWLMLSPEMWPRSEVTNFSLGREESLAESRQHAAQLGCVAVGPESIIQIDKYSKLSTILRIVAWVKRFVNNLKNRKRSQESLTAEELKEAEIYCIKTIQQEFYGREVEDLKCGREISKDSCIFSLCPYIDNQQLLRVKGRLQESEFVENEKHPILLPEKSKYTTLLIEKEHARVMHCGTAATLNEIRKTFWIPKGHQIVKKTLNRCLICRKYAAKPATQITAPLPKDRLLESNPFAVTGLDFAGPVYVKDGKESKKTYITLFTCATTRAIHLELVSDMTTRSFLLAFRRFTARRGHCKIIYSDNAKTFKCAEKELSRMAAILKNREFQDHIASEGISWKYIIEKAAWWGGFYERLVQSVKVCLKKVLGRALLSFEELATLLTEIEMIINSRPLTFTYNEINEPKPLTPNDFLIGTNSNISIPTAHDLMSPNSTYLTRRKQYRQECLKKLWLKWKNEYILQLRSAHHVTNTALQKRGKPIKINDIVLVEGKTRSKFLWNLGRVSDVYEGRDGLIRSCAVRLGDGTMVRRPIQLLYPLEL